MSDSGAVAPALTADEATSLTYLEGVIDRFRKAYFDTGAALREIRDRRLFRTAYGTFAEYCEGRWGGAKVNYAHKLIAAADVVTNLRLTCTIVPEAETQARELTRLEDPAQQVVAWERSLDRVNSDRKRVTAKIVREEVQKLLPEKDDPAFVVAEEVAAVRKAVTVRVKKCPPLGRPKFGAAVAKAVEEVLSELPPPDPSEAAPPVTGDQHTRTADPPAPGAKRIAAHHDPSHPHQQILAAIATLARKLSVAVNESPADSNLRSYLAAVKFMLPRAAIVGEKHLRWRCIGLRGLYHLIDQAGRRRKRPLAPQEARTAYAQKCDPDAKEAAP